MRVITFMVGVGLLLCMALIPLGCQYALTNGPEWLSAKVLDDNENGFKGSCGLLTALCFLGGVAAILVAIPEDK